jgi:hypothetical protein
MSTTTDLTIAAHYGTSEQSLLFKLTAKSFMENGASLQWWVYHSVVAPTSLPCDGVSAWITSVTWLYAPIACAGRLSAFPAEAEVLYPPLTYLRPTGRTEIVSEGDNTFTVVEVEPSMS